MIGNSSCRIYEDFFVQESTSLLSVTTDVTLIGNKTMKKQTGVRMFAEVQRALNVSF
jgi:hypothetical protein